MGFKPMASAFALAAVLYHLSYEDPYNGKQANYNSLVCA